MGNKVILWVRSDVHFSVDVLLSVLCVCNSDHTPCSSAAAQSSVTVHDVSGGHVCETPYHTDHRRAVASWPDGEFCSRDS